MLYILLLGSCYKYCLLHHMFSSNPCFEVTLWSNYYIIMIFGCFTSDTFVCYGIWVFEGLHTGPLMASKSAGIVSTPAIGTLIGHYH